MTQTLSIIYCINTTEFLLRYKTIVFELIFLVIAIIFLKNKKQGNKVIKVIFYAALINLLFNIITYFRLQPIFNFLKQILERQTLEDIELNILKNKFFTDFLDPAIIPLIFYLLLGTKKKPNRFIYIIVILLIFILSYLSNYRTQFLISLIAILTSLITIKKFVKNFIFSKALWITVLFCFLIFFRHSFNIKNSFERIVEPVETDIVTLQDRYYFWKIALDMGLSFPVFGLGLGNFYDYIPNKPTLIGNSFNLNSKFFKITWIHPHNIFFATIAETGFFGLFSIILLFGYFFIGDLRRIKKANKESLIIVSFWCLFLYSLINPSTTLLYWILFWTLRVLILIYQSNKPIRRLV